MPRRTFLSLSFAATALSLSAQEQTPPAADSEPKKAAPAAPQAKPEIKRLGAHEFGLGDIRFNDETREISFPGKLNMVEGLLEYVLVHDSGKAHESLLTTAVSPFDLNVVILLANYRKDESMFVLKDVKAGPEIMPNPKIAPDSLADVFVSWKEGDAEKTARVETWIHNVEARAQAEEGAFVYNGSWHNKTDFLATKTGSFIALYLDATSLLNNARKNNDNDDVWVPAPKLPPLGTEVTVRIRPPVKDKGKAQPQDTSGETSPSPSGQKIPAGK